MTDTTAQPAAVHVFDPNAVDPTLTPAHVVEQIRAEVRKAKGTPAGTIIRFDKMRRRRIHSSHGTIPKGTRAVGEKGPYIEVEEVACTYAAIFVGNRWYLTGETSALAAESPFSHRDFMDILALDDVQNVEVATAFEAVEQDAAE